MNTHAVSHLHWNVDWTQGAAVHGIGWVVVALIIIWLLLGEPLLGKSAYRRFLVELRSGDVNARLRFYRKWTWQSWVALFVMLVLALGVLGWQPMQLGLRLPGIDMHLPTPLLGGLVAGAFSAVVFGVLLARRRKHGSGQESEPRATSNAETVLMLPRRADERRAFAILAITAGITEEIVWRGVGLAMLVALFPHAPPIVYIAVLAGAFGWAHLYQGIAGIIVTAVLGGLLTMLYVTTGGLALPIVVHAVIDLAAMARAPRLESIDASQ
ncbi:MAG TPA: type II CAAX endopeptidase family protein [Rudaea sp.]|nr:type II CAAX endopeptidase family protein [Rudaea sp.]